jgi:hypothetical protein
MCPPEICPIEYASTEIVIPNARAIPTIALCVYLILIINYS